MILLLATYRLLGLYILCGLSLMHDIFVVFFQGNTKMNLVIQDLIVKVKKKNNNMASRIDSNEIVNNVHNSFNYNTQKHSRLHIDLYTSYKRKRILMNSGGL